MKPFLKWAGGKNKISPHIIKLFPEKFNNYYEPFLGGGSIFINLLNKGMIKNKSFLNDKNKELINVWEIIKYDIVNLIKKLEEFSYLYDKDNYIRIRKEMNEETEEIDSVLSAARFIYLNKTCFNGLYRVNSNGKFNTPFGKYKNPRLFEESNLLEISLNLRNSYLSSLDFKSILKKTRENDLVYMDPPYIPISKTSNFVSYNGDKFSYQDHIDLAKISKSLIKRGVNVVISNSFCKESLEIFSGFKYELVEGDRNISGGLSGREKKKEMIIFGLSD